MRVCVAQRRHRLGPQVSVPCMARTSQRWVKGGRQQTNQDCLLLRRTHQGRGCSRTKNSLIRPACYGCGSASPKLAKPKRPHSASILPLPLPLPLLLLLLRSNVLVGPGDGEFDGARLPNDNTPRAKSHEPSTKGPRAKCRSVQLWEQAPLCVRGEARQTEMCVRPIQVMAYGLRRW